MIHWDPRATASLVGALPTLHALQRAILVDQAVDAMKLRCFWHFFIQWIKGKPYSGFSDLMEFIVI